MNTMNSGSARINEFYSPEVSYKIDTGSLPREIRHEEIPYKIICNLVPQEFREIIDIDLGDKIGKSHKKQNL